MEGLLDEEVKLVCCRVEGSVEGVVWIMCLMKKCGCVCMLLYMCLRYLLSRFMLSNCMLLNMNSMVNSMNRLLLV